MKYLHVIDEINAKLMDEYAQLQSKKSKDVESIDRLERMALFHYDRLLEKIPSTKSISSRYTLLQTNVERRGAGSDHSGSNRNKAMKSFDMDGADPNNDPSWCCLS